VPKQILGPNTKVTVNGTDISQFVTNVSVSDEADDHDVTGFGEPYHEHLPGVKDATLTMTVLQGYGASEPDPVLATLYYNSSAGTFKVIPDTSGTVVYTLVGKLYGYNPVNGAVGAPNDTDVTVRNAGTAGLTRGTA
jgi:hypothetical protein